MVSHKDAGGLKLSVSGAGGVRFKKKAGATQRCIGGKMKGVKHASLEEGMGGRHDKKFQQAFVDAAIACGSNVSAAKRTVK